MNPEANQNLREQMEVRLVALLLGEASAFEAAELTRAMADDAELAAFYAQMQKTVGLVKEASKHAPAKVEPDTEQPKLSAERREKLLAQFKQPVGKEAVRAVAGEEGAKTIPLPSEERRTSVWAPLLKIAAALLMLAVIAGLVIPAIIRAKEKSRGVNDPELVAMIANDMVQPRIESVTTTRYRERAEAAMARLAEERGEKPASLSEADVKALTEDAELLLARKRARGIPVSLPQGGKKAARPLTPESTEALYAKMAAKGQVFTERPSPESTAVLTTNGTGAPNAGYYAWNAIPASQGKSPERPQVFLPTSTPDHNSDGTVALRSLDHEGKEAASGDVLFQGNGRLTKSGAGVLTLAQETDGDAKGDVSKFGRPVAQVDSYNRNISESIKHQWGVMQEAQNAPVPATTASPQSGTTRFSGGVGFFDSPDASGKDEGRFYKVSPKPRPGPAGEAQYRGDTVVNGGTIQLGTVSGVGASGGSGGALGLQSQAAGRTQATPGLVALDTDALAKDTPARPNAVTAGALVASSRKSRADETTDSGLEPLPLKLPSPTVKGIPEDLPMTAAEAIASEKMMEEPHGTITRGVSRDQGAVALAMPPPAPEVAAAPATPLPAAAPAPITRNREKAKREQHFMLGDIPAKPEAKTENLARMEIRAGGKELAANDKIAQKNKADVASSTPYSINVVGYMPVVTNGYVIITNSSMSFGAASNQVATITPAEPTQPVAAQVTFADRLKSVTKAPSEPADKNGVALGATELEREVVHKALPAPALLHQPEFNTRENRFSTFSLNVSDVAFKLAAASLSNGELPDANSVRTEEFINAFNYRDPAPATGAPLAFAWERAHYPFAHNRDVLRFSVQTAARGREAQKPLNLVILLDDSGSMERPDRVQIVTAALKVLAGQLQAQDKISVVTFARTARLVVDGLSGGNPEDLLARVLNLNPQGGTDLGAGLDLAYTTALRHFMSKGNNRVVLLTDGAANLGNVDNEQLKQKVVKHRQKGLALDCYGIGWEGYNDDLLQVLSSNGDGRYAFLNDAEQAGPEFANQLAGALNVAAADVKTQVEFNPQRVVAFRQIGYAKHQLTKEQFRDNTVDAAEIAAAEAGNALYIIQVDPQGTGPLGVVRVRYKVPDTGEYVEKEWPLSYQAQAPALSEAGPAMRLATTAAAFGDWLAQNPYAGGINPSALSAYLNGVPEFFAPDPRPRQLATMVQQAISLSK